MEQRVGEFLATRKSERLDIGQNLPLCPGVSLAMQRSTKDVLSWVLHSDNREFVYALDDQGRGCYFYRSFAGTSGKMQGFWYPTGGVFAYKNGNPFWIIKGSPRADPYFGRTALGDLMRALNNVLPHTDDAVDAWIEDLTHAGPYFLDNTKYEIKPTFLSDGTKPLTDDTRSLALSYWKQLGITRTWGPRNEAG